MKLGRRRFCCKSTLESLWGLALRYGLACKTFLIALSWLIRTYPMHLSNLQWCQPCMWRTTVALELFDLNFQSFEQAWSWIGLFRLQFFADSALAPAVNTCQPQLNPCIRSTLRPLPPQPNELSSASGRIHPVSRTGHAQPKLISVGCS
jgi:hypothetical protein